MNIGTLTNEQLVVGTGMVGESIVGLDDSSRWIACVQVPTRITRRGRQDTGTLLDRTTRLAGHTHNIATSTRMRKESPSREMEMQMRARPRDGQAEGVGKTADRGGNVPSLSSSGLLLALSRIKIRTI